MSVRGLRRGAIAASRAAGTPTTYTIYGDAADGYIASQDTLYANARAGTGSTLSAASADAYVGQNTGPFSCYEGFISFDTSTVLGTITAVTLSLYGINDSSTTDFTLEARIHDWGATLTTADWVAGASLSGKTLVASKTTVGWNAAGYNALVSDAAFLSNINKAGFTRLILCSSRQVAGTTPSGIEYVGIGGAERAGTANDPKLVIDALV